ncbi:ATP-dependent Clp protease proteolytic subunit [Arsenophonus endosymbiont of Aleurodicus floccissimus]|nr:ATP-dependent Clp protease proteolytic subunit [Arsenophonus endosymbiont of Aleurodicus floccissimus]
MIVNLNSAGGDMFAGLAIYNLLRAHSAKVTVNVLGIAASVASIIAMAGDEVRMGTGTFLMIHNCWVVGMGNRHDFARLSEEMRPFDKAMADIYAARSGLNQADIEKIMDNETYLGAEEAITQGFTDELMSTDRLETEEETPQAALRKIDALLAKSNTPRSERRKLIKSLTGSKPCATAISTGMPSATVDINPEYLTKLQNAINAFASTTR